MSTRANRSVLLRGELAVEHWLAKLFAAMAANPIRYALLAVSSGLLIGGTVFSLFEDETSVPDGIWWAFVSMTTVGYGDISPKTTEIRFLATFVIATGIAATAILTAALAGRIAEARIAEAGLIPDLDNEFDDLAARLSSLKQRYQQDERHDDDVVRHALAAVLAHCDGDADRHRQAMADLQACLSTHPELARSGAATTTTNPPGA